MLSTDPDEEVINTIDQMENFKSQINNNSKDKSMDDGGSLFSENFEFEMSTNNILMKELPEQVKNLILSQRKFIAQLSLQ